MDGNHSTKPIFVIPGAVFVQIFDLETKSSNPGSRATARALVPGSRLAPFSSPGPLILGKMGGRDDKVWVS